LTTNNKRKFSLSGTFKAGREYLDTRFKLIQLQFAERIVRVVASLLVDLLKAIFALFVLFFLSLALGFYFSELLGSMALGFLATGGIFVLFILILSLLKLPLERWLINLSIKRLLWKWYEGDEEEEKLFESEKSKNQQDAAFQSTVPPSSNPFQGPNPSPVNGQNQTSAGAGVNDVNYEGERK
jgi:hypothetical protein